MARDLTTIDDLTPETVAISDLRPHPCNYREHPADQLEHLIASIEEHGLYRPIVIARDNVILAGHGLIAALTKMGRATAPVYRLSIASDGPRALKVLTGDNEIEHLAIQDDRALTEILKELSSIEALMGTGFDDMMVASLAFVTRPVSEIADFDAAAEWAGAGMPEYDEGQNAIKIVVSFRNAEHRAAFIERLGLDLTPTSRTTWWPPKGREDLASLRFEA
ncbi:hypothetical protein LCGC14_1336600 [marine sediment metagenome]|uniref:ParB-like N-terminal domain-containing protein n=1 Tax=marine sediment metagenome TaxID=412755 RepID=A0A0F9L163_9ZZZZ